MVSERPVARGHGGREHFVSAAELAARLNGREYRGEITPDEKRMAKEAGLVVLFGASDDLAEFSGAVDDEVGCYDGGELFLLDGSVYEFGTCTCEHAVMADERARKRGKLVTAIWGRPDGYSWAYQTEIPHATFDVMEDGEPYCRGIVFALADAEARA